MKKIMELFLIGMLVTVSLQGADLSAIEKALAETAKANAEAGRINLMGPAEAEKLRAEAAKAYAEAQKAIAEAHLTDAKREQVYLEMERLRQRMRITDYEFNRVVSADYKMNQEINFVESQANLVRPLMLGRCNWKTWLGLEVLMQRTGDADVIVQVMFDVPVPELDSSEFVANEYGQFTERFSGGNLGELYSFVEKKNYSFKKFGVAHKQIMKVLAMISKAAELRIRELRDINQAIRLTIAKIE